MDGDEAHRLKLLSQLVVGELERSSDSLQVVDQHAETHMTSSLTPQVQYLHEILLYMRVYVYVLCVCVCVCVCVCFCVCLYACVYVSLLRLCLKVPLLVNSQQQQQSRQHHDRTGDVVHHFTEPQGEVIGYRI